MLNTITTILVALLGIQALAKFVFVALPYRKRKAALDRSYGAGRPPPRCSGCSACCT